MDTPQMVAQLVEDILVINAKQGGAILHGHGRYKTPHIGRVHFQRQANDLAAEGKIERIVRPEGGFYRAVGCTSTYELDSHAWHLTEALVKVYSIKSITTVGYREINVPIGFRADALVFVQRENRGLCFVLEVAHHETHDYLKRKVDAWKKWKGAKDFLSEKFNRPIGSYGFVVAGKEVSGAVPFNQMLRRLA